MDFKDYVNADVEYIYNANGAMTQDLNKGISDIQYNLLNLPRQVDIKSPVAEARNEYTYSATGEKLRVVQRWNPNYSTTPVIGSAVNTSSLIMNKQTDYSGDMIFENGSLKRILVDGGYIENGVYYFYVTGHLGNNYAVVNQGGEVVQKNQYYPFGMSFANDVNPSAQPYKYTGKEADQMHGLNLYDYSARYHDPALGRFTTIDPLAEKYYSISPYVYCMNNPIRFIDPDGREFTDGSWAHVKRLINDIDERQAKNAGNIAQKQAQIDAGGLSGKKVASIQKQIDRLNRNTAELEGVRGEIATLAASNQMYDVSTSNYMTNGAVHEAQVYKSESGFNFTNKNFEIKLSDGSLGTLAHELLHAYQFEIGVSSSGYRRDGQPFYDKTDEWAGYSRGVLFGGERIYSLPSIYDNLQSGPMDATKLAPIILNSPELLQRLANNTQSAFRVNGVTYIMQGRK